MFEKSFRLLFFFLMFSKKAILQDRTLFPLFLQNRYLVYAENFRAFATTKSCVVTLFANVFYFCQL